jgi:hypothetical protein
MLKGKDVLIGVKSTGFGIIISWRVIFNSGVEVVVMLEVTLSLLCAGG